MLNYLRRLLQTLALGVLVALMAPRTFLPQEKGLKADWLGRFQ